MGKPQLDMFAEQEAELFPAEPVVATPDPDRIRRRLNRILSEARAAAAMPWTATTRRLYEKIVPQMSLSLPDDEARQVQMAFQSELDRLTSAPAKS